MRARNLAEILLYIRSKLLISLGLICATVVGFVDVSYMSLEITSAKIRTIIEDRVISLKPIKNVDDG